MDPKIKEMMKRKAILSICLLVGLCGFAANDIVRVSATYEYISDNQDETPAQVEKKAFEAARLRALENRFGIDASRVVSSLQTNTNNDGNASSANRSIALSETSVRGEWIETLKERIISPATFANGFWRIKVYVEGRARSLTTAKADIQYAVIKDIQDLESPTTFRNGNDLFLRFQSPVAGYLCVYLVDEAQNAFSLLPYMNNPHGSQAVEANREYIFFSEKYDSQAQEYTLTSERESEQNILYLIFSPNDFTKAADSQGGTNFQGDQLPRELTYEAFLKWLARNQTRDPEMDVRQDIIVIRK